MPSYLVESYADRSSFEEAGERAERTAELGNGVRYVRTTFLPGDEMVLHLFEAPSIEALDSAASLAALSFERIVPAVESRTPPRARDGARR